MSGELKPCPMCSREARIRSNRDWHHLEVDHETGCAIEELALIYAATDEGLRNLTAAWNCRPAPSLDGLRALVERWRSWRSNVGHASRCADELAAEIERMGNNMKEQG